MANQLNSRLLQVLAEQENTRAAGPRAHNPNDEMVESEEQKQ